MTTFRTLPGSGPGASRSRLAPCDLVPLVRQVFSVFEGTSTRHRLILESPEEVSGHWDRDRIYQLLMNLISNAIKHSPEGGQVLVSLARRDNQVLISVTDEGVGIPPERVAQLFQPFSRVTDDPSTEGTGLGLYISRAIVEAHQGEIGVDSLVGRGTTFWVMLPTAAEETPGASVPPFLPARE